MVQETTLRNFSKVGDALPVPDLIEIQTASYRRLLQEDAEPEKRKNTGLEALLREVFPITSYDENMSLEYLGYELGKERHDQDECRQLRLTYGKPFRIRCRLIRKDKDEIMEDTIYLGELPTMIGGGEFIINGAERVIVSQLHRSPGVDFVKESAEGDRALHACRIIPERGSWIEINVTRKDELSVRIDQSSKIPATTFLRAMDERYSTDESIITEFYGNVIKTIRVGTIKPDMYAAETIVDEESGEELVRAGCQLGDRVEAIQSSELKQISVIQKVQDPLILNTLAQDTSRNHEEALLKIYARLRPGNPPQLDRARKLFQEKFFDDNRYRLGKVGRFRLNRKFDLEFSESDMTLKVEDLVHSLKYLLLLRTGDSQYDVDDIDHLGNRRLRTIDELASEELRKGFLKLRRTVQERMSLKNPDELQRIAELVNSKSISSSIEFFFGRGELSQVVDQTNPLAQLTHERRLSALGPGGLNRKRAGFEVRDVHISHYGRICPIETPEGTNIGLIASLSIYSSVDDYGFLVTPYRVVKNGKVADKEVMNLRADEEMRAVLSPSDAPDEAGRIRGDQILARRHGDLSMVDGKDVKYVDISPKQTVGVSAALIPFLEHDDANRALMGSNMQRQAVPLLECEPPIIATGIEGDVAGNSGMVVRARKPGSVTYVDGRRIILDNTEEYVLRKFVGLNDNCSLNQRPLVKPGDRVKKGQIIADGAATAQGQLALGKNVLVAFMTFDGHNFEDAIVISERLVKNDVFTSIHIEEFEIEIRETKLGREEFTRDIPNVSERALRNLDENGVVIPGTKVGQGDILVGKVSPKSKSELSPEEKLLHAIFGRAGEDVKNDSLEVPAGKEGIVIDTKRFSRRMHMSEDQKRALNRQMKAFRQEADGKIVEVFRQMCLEIEELAGQEMVDPATRQKVGKSEIQEVIMEQVETFDLKWIKPASKRDDCEKIYDRYWLRISEMLEERDRKLSQMKRGDELPSGVLEMVKVYLATKRQLSVGDKMAGRHGNKGVIARIVPEEDMPFLEDGTPVDLLLSPLGVPSRMNIGQILETHLGWAARVLGFTAVTPVFDGATEHEIRDCINEASDHVRERKADVESVQRAGATGDLLVEMPPSGKVTLYDGRTGERFHQNITVGYIYMMKLHHLVDDKIHARGRGP